MIHWTASPSAYAAASAEGRCRRLNRLCCDGYTRRRMRTVIVRYRCRIANDVKRPTEKMGGNSTPSTMEVDTSNTGELHMQPKPHPNDYQALMGSLYEYPSLYDYEPIMGWYEPDPDRDSGSTRARCSFHVMIQTDCIRRLLHARDRQ